MGCPGWRQSDRKCLAAKRQRNHLTLSERGAHPFFRLDGVGTCVIQRVAGHVVFDCCLSLPGHQFPNSCSEAPILRARRHSRVVRLLVTCAASCMLAACASNSTQVQFLPWNSSITTGEAEIVQSRSLERYVPTGTASAESPAVVGPWDRTSCPRHRLNTHHIAVSAPRRRRRRRVERRNAIAAVAVGLRAAATSPQRSSHLRAADAYGRYRPQPSRRSSE